MPTELSPEELADYRLGRDAMNQMIADVISSNPLRRAVKGEQPVTRPPPKYRTPRPLATGVYLLSRARGRR